MNNIISEKEYLLQTLKSNYILLKENLEAQNRIDSLNTYISKDISWRNTLIFFCFTTLIFLLPVLKEQNKFSSYLFVAINASFVLSICFFILMLLTKPLYKKYRFKKLKKTINIEIEKIKNNFNIIDKNRILPEKYLNEYSVRKIIEYFENLRADTLKEAINLLENEKRQNQHLQQLNSLINNQNQIINNQRRMIQKQGQLNSLVKWNTLFR